MPPATPPPGTRITAPLRGSTVPTKRGSSSSGYSRANRPSQRKTGRK